MVERCLGCTFHHVSFSLGQGRSSCETELPSECCTVAWCRMYRVRVLADSDFGEAACELPVAGDICVPPFPSCCLPVMRREDFAHPSWIFFLGVAGPQQSALAPFACNAWVSFCGLLSWAISLPQTPSSFSLVRVRNRYIGRSGASTSPPFLQCLDHKSLDFTDLWPFGIPCICLPCPCGVAGPSHSCHILCTGELRFSQISCPWAWDFCGYKGTFFSTLVRVRNRCIGRSGASTSLCCQSSSKA